MNKPIAISHSTKRVPLPLNELKLNTPKLLKAGLFATWVSSLLMLVTLICAVQAQRHAIQTVGKDGAPSILNAQHIRDSLADIDANAANELLVKPGQNPQAVKGFKSRQEKLALMLTFAAENITYGDAERKPIQTMLASLSEYMQKIQKARDANERGDMKGVLTAYREAAQIIDETLLPAAEALDKANSDELDQIYRTERSGSIGMLFSVVICGLLPIGILVGIQLFLNYRMRRILNPSLLVASSIAIIFLGYTTSALLSASENLRIAKEDAFKSLYALRQTRASAYIANRSESSYLLDKAFAAKHQQTFYTYAAKIASLPENYTFDTIAAAAGNNVKVPNFTGFLADALNNITFDGEREAAIATLKAFGVYFNIDKQIRQLEQSGKHTEALALCTGYEQGQSNWAFEEFKKAHDRVLSINEKEFNKGIDRSFNDLNNLEVISSVALGSIALLTLLGLLPRIKEYEL